MSVRPPAARAHTLLTQTAVKGRAISVLKRGRGRIRRCGASVRAGNGAAPQAWPRLTRCIAWGSMGWGVTKCAERSRFAGCRHTGMPCKCVRNAPCWMLVLAVERGATVLAAGVTSRFIRHEYRHTASFETLLYSNTWSLGEFCRFNIVSCRRQYQAVVHFQTTAKTDL